MNSFLSTRIIALAMMAGAGLAAVAPDADAARRFGGGKSIGKQSDNVQKQAPPAQAAPAPQQAAPVAAPAGVPPAAPARNRWLGPLAGIAAGLGVAALLSHFGMGGAFAEAMMSFLLVGGLIFAGLMIFRLWRNRNAPALAPAGGASRDGITAAPFTRIDPVAVPASAIPAPQAGGGTWTIPPGFEVDDFLHIAKMYFVRLQAAWDAGDERDIRNFTSPEVFAEVKLDLTARTGSTHTEVVRLEAEFLGVEERGETTLASVRLSGLIREGTDAAAEPFREVWNLEKPASAKASWVLAGIQQES